MTEAALQLKAELGEHEYARLVARFIKECPRISLEYVRQNCSQLNKKAERYNRLRRIARSDNDIDNLVQIRQELERCQ